MNRWYARPVTSVADVERAQDFYIGKLGFKQDWRFEEDGKPLVAQVGRGRAANLSCRPSGQTAWAKDGCSFRSIRRCWTTARREFEAAGVEVEDGWWGYRVMIVHDPDGNELLFPYPSDTEHPEDPT